MTLMTLILDKCPSYAADVCISMWPPGWALHFSIDGTLKRNPPLPYFLHEIIKSGTGTAGTHLGWLTCCMQSNSAHIHMHRHIYRHCAFISKHYVFNRAEWKTCPMQEKKAFIGGVTMLLLYYGFALTQYSERLFSRTTVPLTIAYLHDKFMIWKYQRN